MIKISALKVMCGNVERLWFTNKSNGYFYPC